MIHYHGTPISGDKLCAVRFLQNRHALVPFFYPQNLGAVAEVCSSFVFDNSAYTIWKKGGELDYSKYLKWVEEWCQHPSFDWAIIPDIISPNVKDIEAVSRRNDDYIDRWPLDLKSYGVPVYHMDEPIGRFVRLAAEWHRVAIGSAGIAVTPNSKAWWHRMNQMMEAITNNGRPRCKLHGLRMMNPRVVQHIPFASVDSATAGRNANNKDNAMYRPATAEQRAEVIAQRFELIHSPAVWTGDYQEDLFGDLL